jgi:hypothetical protein
MRVTAWSLGIAAIALALLASGCGNSLDTESRADLTVTLDAGTALEVRPLTSLSPVIQEAGDEFTATLARELVKDGRVIAPQGTTVVGEVVDAQMADPGEAGSFLSLELRELLVSGGEPVAIETEPVQYAPSEQGEQVEGIPAPAVVPEDSIVSFRLSEAVEIPVAMDQNEGGMEPIS